ncbi:MAG: ABC transporter permease, partial [Halobacteriota archaeon]
MNEVLQGILQAIQLIVSLNPEVLDITARSLYISLSATLVASLIAIPIGGFIHFKEFGGKRGLITIIQALYALPTVLVGLLVWLLLSRSGPFGFLHLLFTPTGMILGQIVLIVPLMIGMTLIALSGVSQTKQDTVISLGATGLQTVVTIVKE